MPTAEELLALLPGGGNTGAGYISLRDVGRLVGVEAALRIVETWPGVPLYIPAKIGPDHPIARAIGPEAAAKLSAEYPGETLEVPVALKWRLAMRDAIIAASQDSQRTLALGNRLTVRQIRNIQKAARADSGQEKLF